MKLCFCSLMTITLLIVNSVSEANLIIENDWVNSDITASLYSNQDFSEIIYTETHNYTGAATDFQHEVLVKSGAAPDGMRTFGSANDYFSVGKNGYLFYGFITTDDILVAEASASMTTYWEFTPTDDVEYFLSMEGFSDGGPFQMSYSLYNHTKSSLVTSQSELSIGGSIYSTGILQAENSYILLMTLNRYTNTADGGSIMSFSVDTDYIFSEHITHSSVPEPSTMIILGLGLASLSFTRKLKMFK